MTKDEYLLQMEAENRHIRNLEARIAVHEDVQRDLNISLTFPGHPCRALMICLLRSAFLPSIQSLDGTFAHLKEFLTLHL